MACVGLSPFTLPPVILLAVIITQSYALGSLPSYCCKVLLQINLFGKLYSSVRAPWYTSLQRRCCRIGATGPHSIHNTEGLLPLLNLTAVGEFILVFGLPMCMKKICKHLYFISRIHIRQPHILFP